MKNSDWSVSLDESLGRLLIHQKTEEKDMPDTECPSPITMAAFINGRLAEADQQTLRAHLVGCETCREWIGEISHAEATFPDFENVQHDSEEGEEEITEQTKKVAPGDRPHLTLAHSKPGTPVGRKRLKPMPATRWLALAASLVLVVGLSWYVTQWSGLEGDVLTAGRLNASLLSSRLEKTNLPFIGSQQPWTEAFSTSGHPYRIHFQIGRNLTYLASGGIPESMQDKERFSKMLALLKPVQDTEDPLKNPMFLFASNTTQSERLAWIGHYEKAFQADAWSYVLLGEWCQGAEQAVKQERSEYFRISEIKSFRKTFEEQDELPGLLESLEQMETLRASSGKNILSQPGFAEALETLFLLFE